MSTIIKILALCLALLLLLAPVIYLVVLTQTVDQKIDGLHQEPPQVHVNCPIVIIMIDSQTEPTIATEPTVPTETTGVTRPKQQPTEPQPTEPKHPDSTKPADRPANYYGRLCIPDANIDVGLYYGADQAITDRQDSANIFTTRVFDGLYIADHKNQEFSKLPRVKVGMRGYLKLADGAVFNIICTEVLTGHNTGKRITDENGNINFDADFLMYTCRDNSKNVLICLWKHN